MENKIEITPYLTICIPTIVGREEEFDGLVKIIKQQIEEVGAHDFVEIISEKDNKEISIGVKRYMMYQKAKGFYTVQIDDDDSIAIDYIEKVLDAIQEYEPDCITYNEYCDMDGIITISDMSIRYDDWKTNPSGQEFKYLRTPTPKCVIKTTLCKSISKIDLRFGEDHAFSKLIKPLLKSEYHIDEYMYYYTRVTKKGETKNKRYGIK